jgi:hypothetical protein
MADVEVEALEEELIEEVEEEIIEELEDEFVALGGAAEVKLFGKWSFDDIEIRDISLVVCLFRIELSCAVVYCTLHYVACDTIVYYWYKCLQGIASLSLA